MNGIMNHIIEGQFISGATALRSALAVGDVSHGTSCPARHDSVRRCNCGITDLMNALREWENSVKKENTYADFEGFNGIQPPRTR